MIKAREKEGKYSLTLVEKELSEYKLMEEITKEEIDQ